MDNPCLDWTELCDRGKTERVKQEYLHGKPIFLSKPKGFVSKRWVHKVYFNSENAIIQLWGKDDRRIYEIDMEQACTPEHLLHWLFHIGVKGWATPEVLGAVLKIVDKVIREISDNTAEHFYCWRMHDDGEPNGFDWSEWLRKHNKKERRNGCNRNGVENKVNL
jgi:hypothetical protein